MLEICSKCKGECCHPVQAGEDMDNPSEETKNSPEFEKYKELWEKISFEEAKKLRGDFEHLEVVEKNIIQRKIFFYKCKLFDEETSLCKDYENRFETCKSFLCNDARNFDTVKDLAEDILREVNDYSDKAQEIALAAAKLIVDRFGLLLCDSSKSQALTFGIKE